MFRTTPSRPTLSAIGLLFLLGCESSHKTTPSPSTTFVLAVDTPPLQLDPRMSSDATSAVLVRMHTLGLIDVDERQNPIPAAAKKFSTTDFKKFVFELRDDLFFHDGTPVKMEDLIYSIEEYRLPTTRVKTGLQELMSFSQIAQNTIELNFSSPRLSFLSSELPNFRILPKHLAGKKNYSDFPIACGPWKLVDANKNNLVFARHKNDPIYKFSYESLVVKTIQDPLLRELSLRKGESDATINSLPILRIHELKNDSAFQIHATLGSSYQYLLPNFRQPLIQIKDVRRALALATPREALIKHRLHGLATLANTPLVPHDKFYHSSLKPLPSNLEKAKQILKSITLPTKNIRLIAPFSMENQNLTLVIKDSWEQLGFRVRVQLLENAAFQKMSQGPLYDIALHKWYGIPDPSMLSRLFHSREIKSGRNRGAYHNKLIDSLLAESETQTHFQKRQKILFSAQELIAEDFAHLPLWYVDDITVLRKNIKNYKAPIKAAWYPLFTTSKEP